MGTEGLKAFGAGGVVNTDDNLNIEFSAPLSVGVPLMGGNASALYRSREPLLPYLFPAGGDSSRAVQIAKWERSLRAGGIYAVAHVLFLEGRFETSAFQGILRDLDRNHPGYAPARFLKGEIEELVAMNPTLVRAESFALLNTSGEKILVEISAVKVRVGGERAALLFVDNRARIIYGQLYIGASKEELDGKVRQIADEVMKNLKGAYLQESVRAERGGSAHPSASQVMQTMKEIITSMARERGGT
jgi:spermidine synthase